MKRNCRIFLLALLTLLVAGYIFSNSLDSKTESNQKSLALADEIKPVVDPKDTIPRNTFNHYVRKTAHFAEFALLGFCLMALADAIDRIPRIPRIPLALLAALLIASADETLQFFSSGRGPGIRDVLIDFSGAACGLALMLLLLLLQKRGRKKRENKFPRHAAEE